MVIGWFFFRGKPSPWPSPSGTGISQPAKVVHRRTSVEILGISAFYHDSAACLVVDGEIIAAAQEERFTRIKHDHNFPVHAARYCLREAGISAEELDYVGFYDKPLLKFDRLLETYLDYAPSGFRFVSQSDAAVDEGKALDARPDSH